ncbi:5580_t:CDS:2, partial [Racocetra fulgida]
AEFFCGGPYMAASWPKEKGCNNEFGAIGTLVFSDDNGHHEQLIDDDALWLDDSTSSTTFNILGTIDHNNKPSNVWADVWATVYWACQKENCASEHLHLR